MSHFATSSSIWYILPRSARSNIFLEISLSSPTRGDIFAPRYSLHFFLIQLKHYILRKFLDIVLHLAVEVLCFISIYLSQIKIQHHLHTTDGVYLILCHQHYSAGVIFLHCFPYIHTTTETEEIKLKYLFYFSASSSCR